MVNNQGNESNAKVMRPIVGKIPGFSAIGGSASGRKFGGQWRFKK